MDLKRVIYFGVSRAVCAAAIVLLLAWADTLYATDRKNCPSEELASVELATNGSPLVPVRVRDQPAWMVLQIHAASTLIYENAARALQLPIKTLGNGDGFEFTVGGRRVTEMATLEPLEIGGLRISRTQFLVDPFPHVNVTYQGQPVAGSLAMDVLWPFDLAALDSSRQPVAKLPCAV